MTRVWKRIKSFKQSDGKRLNTVPIYLIVIPATMLSLQIALADKMVEYGRNKAIDNSAQIINDIENYFKVNGHYPAAITGLHQDYQPVVIGVKRYDYVANGNSYNLFFEQYRFYPLGTREIVMYNKDDKHVALGHASWVLTLSPSQLTTSLGHYAEHYASRPHWKYFLYD